MKKIFSILMLVCFTFVLASCGEEKAKFSYVDAETNEIVEVVVGATNDSATVASVMEHLPVADETLPSVEANGNVKFSMNVKMTMGEESEKMSSAINMSFDASCNEDYGYLSINGEMDVDNTKSTINSKSYADLYDQLVYTKNYEKSEYSNDGEKEVIEETTYSVKPVEDLFSSFSDMSSSMLPGFDLDLDFDNLVSQFEVSKMVEDYEIVISSTTANSITFKFAIGLEDIGDITGEVVEDASGSKMYFYMTYDLKVGSVTRFKIDGSTFIEEVLSLTFKDYESFGVSVDVDAKFTADFKMAYKTVNVPQLTDEEKAFYSQNAE